MDLIKARSLAFIDKKRVEFFSHPASYSRGEVSIPVNVTTGRSVFNVQNDAGFVESFEATDFIISVSELVISGQETEPLQGDKVIDVENGETKVYEVSKFGNARHFEAVSPFSFRIHTKRVS